MGIIKKFLGIKSGKYTKRLTLDQKTEIQALRDDGLTPRDIVEEMQDPAITIQAVYRIIELKKLRDTRKGIGVDDPIRAIKTDIARLQLEREKQALKYELEDQQAERQLELDELLPDLANGDVDPMTLIATALLKNMNNIPNPGSSPAHIQANGATSTYAHGSSNDAPMPTGQTVSDEELLKAIKDYPQQVVMLKTFSPEKQLEMIKAYFPALNEATAKRAIILINEVEVLENGKFD